VSATILSFRNFRPRIADDAFIASTAVLIGDCEIGADCGIWFGCVLRADGNIIRIGPRSNIQDGTVIHVNSQPDGGRGAPGYACHVGSGVTVGHMALLHGCTLEDGAFVGMKACVMDGVVVEGQAMVAAGALVTPGKRVKRGELWAGSPAKLLRQLNDGELELFKWTAEHYVGRAREYRGAR
jgi:carbonic anhydrase/acetyltransferase-like protein (isoleucine patch superfamily)